MAKVKITGHASGTGILTVTAPNTSTDRTITLPDATGTLLNSDGSGASLTSLPNQKVNPNLIINGAMQVAQRSTSTVAQADGSNEGFATLDRWNLQFGNSAGGTITTSQDTESPAGFGHSMKLDVTTADASISGNELVYLNQAIEAQNMRSSGWEYTSASSDITFSFWVRSSKTGIYCVHLLDTDGGERQYTWEYTVSSADTWEKKTQTIPGEANLDFDNNAEIGLSVSFMLGNASGRYGTAGSWATGNHYGTSNQVNFLDSTSNVMYLTGVKLEIGDTATDFEYRSYAEELALCQRYYTESRVGYRGAKQHNADVLKSTFELPVPMRVEPTVTDNNGGINRMEHDAYSGSNTSYATSIESSGGNNQVLQVSFDGFSGGTDNRMALLLGSGILYLDAEL